MQKKMKLHAYMSPAYQTIEGIIAGKDTPIMLSSASPNIESEGYVLIGVASAVLDVMPNDKIVAAQVAALRVRLEKQRADAQRAEDAILAQISKLTALPMSGVSA